MNDLKTQLRQLSEAKISDLSIAADAADLIDALVEALIPLARTFLYPDDLGFETSDDIKADPDWCDDANDATSQETFILRKDIRRARKVIEMAELKWMK